MRIKKLQLIDILLYTAFLSLTIWDYAGCLFSDRSLTVILSFLPIGAVCISVFFASDGFLTIDQVFAVFLFMFCYYTPLHQYIKQANIHNLSRYTDRDYLYANVLILLFLGIYCMVRWYGSRKREKTYRKYPLHVNTNALILFAVISVICIIWLQLNHVLFSTTEALSEGTGESLTIVIRKIIRFLPMSALLLSIYSMRDRTIVGVKKANLFCMGIISMACLLIYFPINGTLSRYLLFGTYLMVLRALLEKFSHKSLIILAAFLGFYMIFPAFNFFKYHTMRELTEFQLGGFDVTYSDYDAYQMFMQAVKYVREEGLLWGKNILTAALCIVPRSIWTGKMSASGVLIAEYYNASFTNLSCPLFAEFYLAFGLPGIVVFTAFFAGLINRLEIWSRSDNCFLQGMYSVAVGMIIPFARGALLPMTSFWVSLSIAMILCCVLCILCKGGRRRKKVAS